jgi:hypothetical protein
MRQRPGTSKRVVFATAEDESGAANLVVWAARRQAWPAALTGAP